MKKLLIALSLLFFFPSILFSEQIMLEWDMPAGQVDGVNVYQKTAHEWDYFDYDNPVKTVTNGNSIIVTLPGEDNKVLQYLWVVRAFRGEKESVNSNQVSYKVVNTLPLRPIGLVGNYNSESKTIRLEWEQENERHPVDHWIVYYRIGEEEFLELGEVNHGQELTMTTEFDPNPSEPLVTVAFAVVAFRRSGVFSENSEEVEVIIDRTNGEVNPIENLKIRIDIPL